MKKCPVCFAEIEDNAEFCPICGAKIEDVPAIKEEKPAVEFDKADAKESKLFAILCYTISYLGILLAYIAKKDSPYLMYHTKQATKILVLEVFAAIIAAALSWTVIVPVAYAVFCGAMLVVKVFAVIDCIRGNAKELFIIKWFKFLD